MVRADPQTNSIIVDAPVQRMAGFDQLVEQLDRARITEETEIRTYEIVHAELDAVARTLRELASGGALSTTGQDRRAPILVSTEIASRRLIISSCNFFLWGALMLGPMPLPSAEILHRTPLI